MSAHTLESLKLVFECQSSAAGFQRLAIEPGPRRSINRFVQLMCAAIFTTWLKMVRLVRGPGGDLPAVAPPDPQKADNRRADGQKLHGIHLTVTTQFGERANI